ncbi:hypothetical protein GCM10010376_76810 [Streptomyces violaceusniger]
MDGTGGTGTVGPYNGTAAGLAQVHRYRCCHTACLRSVGIRRIGRSRGRWLIGDRRGSRSSEYQKADLHMSITNLARFFP